jgi:hypothetical protein
MLCPALNYPTINTLVSQVVQWVLTTIQYFQEVMERCANKQVNFDRIKRVT